MGKLFYFGFLIFTASTILFIVSILTRQWILKDSITRGIFEVCASANSQNVDPSSISCKYILTYSDDLLVIAARSDYAIACSSLSIIASSLGIIFIWVSGLYMCITGELARKIITSVVIAGNLLIDCTTVVVWVIMLAKNLDANNNISRSQIGWSLWMAVGSTGGYLISLVLFCMHRIDIGASSPYDPKRQDNSESREYLQRF